MKLNSHHLDYESDYKIEIPWIFHKPISTAQRAKATKEWLTLLFNIQRSLAVEIERMARDLDNGTDTRVKKHK